MIFIVQPSQQAVKTFLGRTFPLLTATNGLFGTGLHWSWPFGGKWERRECKTELVVTQPQRIGDRTFSLLIHCRIENLADFTEHVEGDFKQVVADLVAGAAGELALDALELDIEWAEHARNIAQLRSCNWGIDIKRVSIVTATTNPSIHVIGSTAAILPDI